MNAPLLTEIDVARRLGCSTLRAARVALRQLGEPVIVLPDGPRYTETQLRALVGEPGSEEPDIKAAEQRLLTKLRQ